MSSSGNLIMHEASTLCMIFMILVSLENVKKYAQVVARLPQRLKSTLFEIFFTLRVHIKWDRQANVHFPEYFVFFRSLF